MAQYRMGTLREEGLGAPPNRVHAYAGLSLVATEWMTEVVQVRDELVHIPADHEPPVAG